MTDLELFEKYQKQLVWFINTKIGRWFFKVDEEIKNICNVAPNALTYDKHLERKENGEWREVKTTCFRTNAKYARLLNYRLAPLRKLALAIPSLARPELSPFLVPVMLTTDTYYPGASGTNNPVDGQVARSSVNETFSTIIDGNGTSNAYTPETAYAGFLQSSSTTNQFSGLIRGIFCFLTSDIGTNNIDSVLLSLYAISSTSNLGSTNLHVCQSNPASTTVLANSDFEGMKDYTTSFGSVSSTGFSGGYKDITLNASGISNINKTGISKFGTKIEWDINSSFSSTWFANKISGFTVYMSNYAGTTYDPKLTVTHSAAITFIPQITFY